MPSGLYMIYPVSSVVPSGVSKCQVAIPFHCTAFKASSTTQILSHIYVKIYLFTGLLKLNRISFHAAGFRLEAGLGEECIGVLVDYPDD